MKRGPVLLLAAAAGCVLAGGALIAVTWHVPLGHGLYCSVGTAATVGCDIAPRTGPGEIAAVAVMLTAIPLLAAVFARLHLDKIREHVDARLDQHHKAIHDRFDRLDRIEQGTTAGAVTPAPAPTANGE